MNHLSALLIPAILLAACGHGPEPDRAEAEAEAAAVVSGSETDGLTHEPRMAALPFRLDVTMSGDVRQALDAVGARLTITAAYSGKARQGSGTVNLGMEEREISARDQSVTLAGRFDAAQVAREVSGDPRVTISAGVARSAGPVVYCTEFDEALTLAVETGGYIHCELIRE